MGYFIHQPCRVNSLWHNNRGIYWTSHESIQSSIRMVSRPRTVCASLWTDVSENGDWFFKLVAWYSAYVYHHRPRGWSRRDLLEIRQSSLGENAGMGVFSKQMIMQDTVLGSYPGYVRNDAEMTAKSIVAPMSRYYCFSTRPGCIIDPTGEDGYPSERPTPPSGKLSWWPHAVDTALSYVNEPSINSGVSVNVRVEDDPDDPLVGLLFRADRDIQPGEELFIDYGTMYDRSMYAK